MQLAPTNVRHHSPADTSIPSRSQIRLPDSQNPEDVLRISYGSEVSFQIPSGSASFSAVISQQPNLVGPVQGAQLPNLGLVEVRLDDKPALELPLDGQSPPEFFRLRLGGAHVLTFHSESQFNGGVFYLARARFSGTQQSTSRAALLAAGEGYVEFAGEPRQALLGVFRPGENVPLHVYSADATARAQLILVLRPENGGAPASTVSLSVPLAPVPTGGSAGVAVWKVPARNGPAQLEITETIQGRRVWRTTMRVAVLSSVDLSRIPDSPFGVHLSTAGFPLLTDRFANLWGAKWARLYLRWSIVEPQQGQYDFSRADELVNLYRAQNMRILGVLGEDFPGWTGQPGPAMYSAWARFVRETAKHFDGKIDHWDLFNEVDVKFYGRLSAADPDSDVSLLRMGLDALRDAAPKSTVVCCSTGTSAWLTYDQRLLDKGILQKVDVASLHPYESFAPEIRQGIFDYPGTLDALRQLMSKSGSPRPLWATEANWILGPPATPNVNASLLNEHLQAQYVVRANLLSFAQGVPYFVHSPFSHFARPKIHLDTLAAYAAMSSFFSGADSPRWLANGPDAESLVASNGGGLVGALWSVVAGSRVRLDGALQVRFFDLYGNPLSLNPDEVVLSPDPIYFHAASGSAPRVSVLSTPAPKYWQSLPSLETWTKTQGSSYSFSGGTMHVRTAVSKYAYQLRSPAMPTQSSACYEVKLKLRVLRGAIALLAVDADSGKGVGQSQFISYPPESRPSEATLLFQTAAQTSVRIIVSNGNIFDTDSEFEVMDPVQIRTCRVEISN